MLPSSNNLRRLNNNQEQSSGSPRSVASSVNGLANSLGLRRLFDSNVWPNSPQSPHPYYALHRTNAKALQAWLEYWRVATTHKHLAIFANGVTITSAAIAAIENRDDNNNIIFNSLNIFGCTMFCFALKCPRVITNRLFNEFIFKNIALILTLTSFLSAALLQHQEQNNDISKLNVAAASTFSAAIIANLVCDAIMHITGGNSNTNLLNILKGSLFIYFSTALSAAIMYCGVGILGIITDKTKISNWLSPLGPVLFASRNTMIVFELLRNICCRSGENQYLI
jgi:hypothetical protein